MIINDDSHEKNFEKYITLIYDKENTIKILLEGNLKDASYMFQSCENMKIKFYKNFNDTRRKIFDKSNIKNMSFMFYEANNIEMNLSFFNSKNVEDMGNMFYKSHDLKMNPNETDSNLLKLSFLKSNEDILN